MMRRVLANGSNTFGMTMHLDLGRRSQYGTMLRVKRVPMHPDGRSAVEMEWLERGDLRL
ncbi:hypothetical protein BC826DRAFT_998641 [Russula brevipes]|nr:hypothetical protein BC826DRAFT_998641 [Russula brevipes]